MSVDSQCSTAVIEVDVAQTTTSEKPHEKRIRRLKKYLTFGKTKKIKWKCEVCGSENTCRNDLDGARKILDKINEVNVKLDKTCNQIADLEASIVANTQKLEEIQTFLNRGEKIRTGNQGENQFEQTCGDPEFGFGGFNPNGIFDMLMSTIRNTEGYSRFHSVTIPDLATELTFPVQLVTITADFKATHGTLSNLLSLKRAGDIVLSREGDTNVIKARVTLPVCKIFFGAWAIKHTLIGWSGSGLTLDINRNKFDAEVHIRMDDSQCYIRFFRFKILELADVAVDIGGFFVANPVASVAVEAIIQYFNKYIIEVAEKYAIDMLNGVLLDELTCRKVVNMAMSGTVAGDGGGTHTGSQAFKH